MSVDASVADGADEQISLTLKLPLALTQSLSLPPSLPPCLHAAAASTLKAKLSSTWRKEWRRVEWSRSSACSSKAAACPRHRPLGPLRGGLDGLDQVREKMARNELCRRRPEGEGEEAALCPREVAARQYTQLLLGLRSLPLAWSTRVRHPAARTAYMRGGRTNCVSLFLPVAKPAAGL